MLARYLFSRSLANRIYRISLILVRINTYLAYVTLPYGRTKDTYHTYITTIQLLIASRGQD